MIHQNVTFDEKQKWRKCMCLVKDQHTLNSQLLHINGGWIGNNGNKSWTYRIFFYFCNFGVFHHLVLLFYRSNSTWQNQNCFSCTISMFHIVNKVHNQQLTTYNYKFISYLWIYSRSTKSLIEQKLAQLFYTLSQRKYFFFI